MSGRRLLVLSFTFMLALAFTQFETWKVKATPIQDEAVLSFDMETMYNSTALDDLSPNTNYGNITGATSTTGKYGNALQFDGVNDYVNVTDDDSLDGMSELTVMAWIKWVDDGTAFHMIIRKVGSYYMEVVNLNQRLDAVIWTDTNSEWIIGTAYDLPPNEWVHVGLVYNGTYVYLFVNGQRSGVAKAITGNINATATNLQIGIEPSVCLFNGTIDDVHIFDSALTQTQIQNGMSKFIFHGVFDEDTGLLKSANERAVNVTTYFSDGSYPNTFEVNGTYEYGSLSSTSVQYFLFDLTNNREYWVSEEETLTDIYIFDESLTSYYISFLDLAGVLETYAWVTAARYINGSLMVVEKRKADVEKAFTMSLKNGQKYTIKVEAEAGTPYTFGDLLMTDDTTPQLTIKGLEFPDNIILAYKYLRIYADRQLGAGGVGNITVTYQDLKEATVKVTITIKFDNGSVAYGPANETSNSFAHTWESAYNNTNYRVIAEISHGQFGVLTEKWYLPRSWSKAPWGLGILGTLPFDTSVLIPAAIIIMVGLIFSALTVPIACFLVTAVATILNYLGWIPGGIDGRALVAAWAFSILVALVWATRRVRT